MSPRHTSNGSATGCRDPRTHGAQSLRRVCYGSRDSPSNHPGMALERATASRNGKSKNQDFPAGIQHRAAIRVPPHAPNLLWSQAAQRGANACPPSARVSKKQPPQCFRLRKRREWRTWPPWGVGRGPRTSWNARRKARPGAPDIAPPQSSASRTRVAAAAVAAGLVHAAMDAGEEPRRGRMANQIPDWDEFSQKSWVTTHQNYSKCLVSGQKS